MADPSENFWVRYSTLCIQSKLCPLKSVLRHLYGKELCCPVEAIRPEHWPFVLSALSEDNSLFKVHFASAISPHDDDYVKPKRNKRDKGFPDPYGRTEENIRNICVALAGTIKCSQELHTLKLENLSLKISDVVQLAAGLEVSWSTLRILSFSGCQFEDGAIPILCKSLHNSKLVWLDLSSCALTSRDIKAVCLLIKAHSVRRSNEMFPDTLRYKMPYLDSFKGLIRVSLNYNLLENDSILLLAEHLTDDFWIKAIDLQNCGVEDEGAEAFLKLVCAKSEIETVDLRLNDIDDSLLNRIEQQLLINRAGKSVLQEPLSLWQPSEMVRKYNAVRKVKHLSSEMARKYNITRKIKVPKKPSVHKLKLVKKASKNLDQQPVKPSSVVRNKTIKMKNASVQTSFDEIPVEVPKPVQAMFCEIRNKYQYEMKLRKFFMSKYSMLKDENDQLQEILESQSDDIYIDHETYFDIKKVFEKLRIFFKVMKKYGLWEYITMMGFDDSTDVILTENDSIKQMTVVRKSSACSHEDKCRLQKNVDCGEEPCCKCQKIDPKHQHTESCSEPEEPHNNTADENAKALHRKYVAESVKDYLFKEKGTYRLLQDLVNDYDSSTDPKHVPGKQANSAYVVQDKTKSACSKEARSLSSKDMSGAHMFIKKFSYSNMPKKLKELISPADFYNVVKKELERCEKLEKCEAKKPYHPPMHMENSSQTSSNIASLDYDEKYVPSNISKPKSVLSNISESKSVPIKISESVSVPTKISESSAPTNISESKSVPTKITESYSASMSNKQYVPFSEQEPVLNQSAANSKIRFPEDMPLSRLLKNKGAYKVLPVKKNHPFSKYIPTTKESAKSSVSSEPSSKTGKDAKEAYLSFQEALFNSSQTSSNIASLDYDEKYVPSNISTDPVLSHITKLTKSKMSSTSSQTSNKNVQAGLNTSSDKNSSLHDVTIASDKLPSSSVSSSPSSKVPSESSSNLSNSEPQKSYIESVSDASTFKDVKSISVSEIASEVLDVESVSSGTISKQKSISSRSSKKKVGSNSVPQSAEAKASYSENKNTLAKSTKDESVSSQSSTMKDVPETKNSKVSQPVMPKSPVESTSKRTDKLAKAAESPKEKTKNKKNSKNRPKNNSKSSSSVPSFSDITTVSSQNLNTDSVMKQISGSEGEPK